MAAADPETSGAGSDYMSYTKLGYPAAFASEGNPLSGGKFPGDYDPYVHGVNDTMDVDDESGVFSLDVSPCSLSLLVLKVILTRPYSTWLGSRSLLLPLLSSRLDGTTSGGKDALQELAWKAHEAAVCHDG